MRIIRATTRFRRDLKRIIRPGKDTRKLEDLVELIAKGDPLADTYKDHALLGEWHGYRDAHIEPDWLLVYRIQGDVISLEATGTHSDLFRR